MDPQLSAILNALSDDELRMLNQEIVARLNQRIERRLRQAVLQFEVGQSVEFDGPDGRVVRGSVKRVNQKTITITTPGGLWRVSPRFVRATTVVENAGASPSSVAPKR